MLAAGALMVVVLAVSEYGLSWGLPGWTEGSLHKLALAGLVFSLIAIGALTYGATVWAFGLGELLPRRFLPKRLAGIAQVAKASESTYDEP